MTKSIDILQKRLLSTERKMKKLCDGLAETTGADLGVNPASYTEIEVWAGQIQQSLKDLHLAASKIAATSTDAGVQAKGPGNKRED